MLTTEPIPQEMPVDQDLLIREKFGRAIGRLASGVFVVTCEREGRREGILMTWIAQAAFEPPMISMAIKGGRPILTSLTVGSHFVVNVLSKTNNDIFKNFAKPDLKSEDRFAGLPLLAESGYGPVFSAAVAYLSCCVRQSVLAGDHNLIVAEVVGGNTLNADADPMVHFRKHGFQY